MSRSTETPTQRLRRMAHEAAIRSAQARSRRAALRRPDGREIEIAFGKALVEVLARQGMLTDGGRFVGSALTAHPDLVAVVSTATQALAERYAAAEVADVLQARLAA